MGQHQNIITLTNTLKVTKTTSFCINLYKMADIFGDLSPVQNGHGEIKISEEHQKKQKYDELLDYSKSMTKCLFGSQIYTYSDGLLCSDPATSKRTEILKNIRARDQYGDLTESLTKQSHPLARTKPADAVLSADVAEHKPKAQNPGDTKSAPELSLVLRTEMTSKSVAQSRVESAAKSARALVLPWMNSIDVKSQAMEEIVKPEWHRPWKLYRMISGHNGWVHSLAVDPSNMWFASGCRDGLIKIWDIASGRLRITLTGHISGVRGLAVSSRHPYLFSCGDDKMVKCWDLEQNQVVRHYHGHLSGVYCLSLHPTENILITGGRDSVGRVWDMRTKEQIHCLTGHTNTLGAIRCLNDEPQIITGSYDTTIRLWDLKMARTMTTLTHHKKSVRALALKTERSSFASGATDNIKQWTLPEGNFIQNLSGHDSIVNCLGTSDKHNVLVSGADNGTLFFWDWRTGYNFQRLSSPPQPGSIESEAGILAMTFDQTGARLITGESDKTIKMFREDPEATEESHPIDWRPNKLKRSRF